MQVLDSSLLWAEDENAREDLVDNARKEEDEGDQDERDHGSLHPLSGFVFRVHLFQGL